MISFAKAAMALLITACIVSVGQASEVAPVHLSPSAPAWAPFEETKGPQRRTAYQNPQNLNANAFTQGFEQGSTPILDATRDAAQDLGRWGSTTARDLGQGTRNAAEGVYNGVRDSLQATGGALANTVENTLNVGNDNYYQQRQAANGATQNYNAQNYNAQNIDNRTTVPPPSNSIANSFTTPLANGPRTSNPTNQNGLLQQPGTGQAAQAQQSQFGATAQNNNFGQGQQFHQTQNQSTNPGQLTGPRFELPQRFSETTNNTTNSNQGFETRFDNQVRPSRVAPVPRQLEQQFVQPQPPAQQPAQPSQQNWGTRSWDNLARTSPPANNTVANNPAPPAQTRQTGYTPPAQTGWDQGNGQSGQSQQTNLASMDPNRANFAEPSNTTQQQQPPVIPSNTPIMLGVGLIGSLALNLFVGWSFLDIREKYRYALRRSPRELRTVA